jgi:hypothetical protein
VRPVSAAFLATIRGSHTMVARARVCSTFQTGTDPAGTTVDVIAGSVTIDGAAAVRSTVDITLDGTGMWPVTADALLAPYGNELFIERGIYLGGGGTEMCSLGYLRIETPSQDAPPDGPIRIAGQDRMAGLIKARLLSPRQFSATDTFGAVMSALVTEVYPAATIQWDAGDGTAIGAAVITQDDRFKFLDDMVASLGKLWYWDHRGILVVADPPDPTTPVYTVDSGADGVLISASRQLTREGVFNAVVATGDGAGDASAPVRAVAYDNNAASPTYYYGRFGPVPEFYSSPFITTDVQAASAASARLRAQLGLPYNLDLSTVPNPALEPYDPIATVLHGVAETHILEQITVPLAATDPMSAKTREQTTVLIGTG